MEPFGAVSGGLEVVSVVTNVGKTSYKVLKRMRNAPQEFQELVDDALELHQLFRNLKDVEFDQPPGFPHEMVERGRRKLLELNKLIDYKLIKPGDSPEVDRKSWARHKAHAQALVQTVRVSQQTIMAKLSADT